MYKYFGHATRGRYVSQCFRTLDAILGSFSNDGGDVNDNGKKAIGLD